MKILVEYHLDYGRHGSVRSLFVSTREELETLYGKRLYFGEILGKHSEVIDERVERNQIEIKSEDQDFIEKLIQLLAHRNWKGELGRTISGHNPFDYIEDESGGTPE